MPRTNAPSSVERWYVLMLMCLIYAINIADRYVVSTVLEPIRIDLHLDDDGVGMLTSWPLALFYVTCGIPISWIADRSNRRNILSISLIVWSGFTALCGLSRGWVQFALARIGAGIGEAGGTPPSTAIVSDCFPPDRRPMAMTVLALGAPIGAWIALDVAGEVARIYDWRHAFLALGVPGLVVGLIVYLTIREPPRGRLDEIVDELRPSVKETWRFFWEQKAVFHVVMGGGVCALWGWGLMYWTQPFVQRTYHMSPGDAASVTANAHLVGGAIATIVTGWLMARPAMASAKHIMWLLGAGTFVATIASGVAYWTRDLEVARISFWIFIPAIYFYIGPCFGLLNNLAPCRMRAMFCAMTLFLANVGNLIITPLVIGALNDHFAAHYSQADALRLAMLCIVPTGLWATLHYFIASRDVDKEQLRARTFPY